MRGSTTARKSSTTRKPDLQRTPDPNTLSARFYRCIVGQSRADPVLEGTTAKQKAKAAKPSKGGAAGAKSPAMRRSSKSAKAPAKTSGFARKSSKGPSAKSIAAMFTKYAELGDSPGEAVDMSGICQLGEDIGIDAATDVSILVLVWKLGAKAKPGHVTEAEWTEGMEALGADSTDKLKEQLPSFDLGFMEAEEFREFYKFTFQFSREGTHRTIERDVAAPLMQMVMGSRSRYTEEFVEFLQQCPANTRVTFDQWSSFLEFSNTVKDDFQGYDEEGAWPILLDEFVEYVKAKGKDDGASGKKRRP